MIFKRLFKRNAWEHKDSTVRVTAIQNELSVNNDAQTEILRNMLNTDDSELVRRAVLHKINAFEEWVNASQHNSDANIKHFASSTVEDIVLDNHEIKLSKEQKQKFLNDFGKSQLLEAWLKKERTPDLVLQLFNKISKPQLLIPTFTSHKNMEVQLALLSIVNEIDVLEKLQRKTKLPEVIEQLTSKLGSLKEKQEKPKKILKQAQLVLAKYLAIKDVIDYEEVVYRTELLETEWHDLSLQFSLLDNETEKELTEKLGHIKAQLHKLFAPKAEAFEQQKITSQLEYKKKNDRQEVSNKLKTLDETLSNAIFQNTDIEEAIFRTSLSELSNFVAETSLSEKEQAAYLAKVEVLAGKLSKLPQIAESVTEATHLISRMSQATLPKNLSELTEKEQSYKEWLSSWKYVNVKADRVLPQSLVCSYQQIVSSWNSALKPLHDLQKKNFFQAQRKLKDVERLIDQGKYNAAFGVFKKAEKYHELLSAVQQQKLEKDYVKTKESIDDLSDWENYIATPKKQMLLKEVSALAESPYDSPSEQAKAVKEYRSRWNILGHADEEIDQELNNRFNDACEKAFAPCRLFYAEQEKLREQHLFNRNVLLNDLKDYVASVNSDDCDWKSVSNKVSQLKKKWRESGDIERSAYQELNRQFNELIQPISEGVTTYNQNNVAQKELLIKRAQELTLNDDVYCAVEEIKSLQTQWKTIGHCGSREENRLWKQFRQMNDLVFDKRAKQQVEEKDKHTALVEQYQVDLGNVVSEISQCSQIAELKVVGKKLSSLLSIINGSTKERALTKEIEENQKVIANKIEAIKSDSSKQLWRDIFKVLEFSIAGDIAKCIVLERLPNHISKKLVANSKAASIEDRRERTIELEVLASKESPVEDKEKRLAIQVSLMQQQIESGQAVEVEDKFWHWILLGKLSSDEVSLLSRVKRVMLVN